jgi:hypothetical protein
MLMHAQHLPLFAAHHTLAACMTSGKYFSYGGLPATKPINILEDDLSLGLQQQKYNTSTIPYAVCYFHSPRQFDGRVLKPGTTLISFYFIFLKK